LVLVLLLFTVALLYVALVKMMIGLQRMGHRTSVTLGQTPSRTRFAFLVGLALGALTLTDCTITPVIHPLRASNGPFLDYAWALGALANKPVSQDCVDPMKGGEGTWVFTPIQLSAGYAHVFRESLGVMAGAYLPAWRPGIVNAGSVVGGFTYLTLQNDHWALGLGPEFSDGFAITAGAEAQPWGERDWLPAFGIHSRYFWPWKNNPHDVNGQSRSIELGARFRLGAVWIQYTYYRHLQGVLQVGEFAFESETPSDAYFGRDLHLISLGGNISPQTLALGWPERWWQAVFLGIVALPVAILGGIAQGVGR
jgi:hypothetical protein